MSKKILVIQHVPNEGLGTFEDELKLQNLTWETFVPSGDAIFPSGGKIEEYGALIVLGGPMGAYEEDKYPWLKRENLVIQEALRQKKPILGVCLGSQLLAKAIGHGGRVYKGPKAEIGWYPIKLDDWFYKRNPLFFQMDPKKAHIVFQWHHDTFDIPTEGYRLAWNDNYPNQAFCFQGNAVGLQFHAEVTEAMIKDWLKSDDAKLDAMKAGHDPARIVMDITKNLPVLRETAHKIIYGFTSLIRENIRRVA